MCGKSATDAIIYLKAEILQRTGTFKARGAFYKLLSLSPSERARGIVAYSGGNHAQGCALAAASLGISAVIVMYDGAPLQKVRATAGYLSVTPQLIKGSASTRRSDTKASAVELYGTSFDDARERALAIERAEGRILVPAYDDPYVMAGQGTIGLEIVADWPDVDVIVVPIGGGGLIGGIAIAARTLKPTVRVVGVESSVMPVMAESLKARKPVTKDRAQTIADGININSGPSWDTLNIAHHYIDPSIILVEDSEINHAIRFLEQRCKLVVEGAGATGVAALLSQKLAISGKRVVVVLSGGNIDPRKLAEILAAQDESAAK